MVKSFAELYNSLTLIQKTKLELMVKVVWNEADVLATMTDEQADMARGLVVAALTRKEPISRGGH